MAVGPYYRAYELSRLRHFSGWVSAPPERELADDTIAYVRDDLVVVTDPLGEEVPIWDRISPAWEDFCRTVLGFSIPRDVQANPPSDSAPPGNQGNPTGPPR
jgi:hypothetical protein